MYFTKDKKTHIIFIHSLIKLHVYNYYHKLTYLLDFLCL